MKCCRRSINLCASPVVVKIVPVDGGFTVNVPVRSRDVNRRDQSSHLVNRSVRAGFAPSPYHAPMAEPQTRPAPRRIGLYVLILLALAMMSGVLFVLVTGDDPINTDTAFPEPVILDPEKRPRFVFDEAVRTYDLSLNQFVDRFARVCMEGRYSDFRLMLSTRQPPTLPPRFESNFNALKEVRILGLEKLPDLPGSTTPVYLMKAQYEVQDFAVRHGQRTRQVHVAVARENGQWRIGPIPREALARYQAYKQATTQPAENDAELVTEVLPTASVPTTADHAEPPPPATRAAANRPIKIGP
jgi:hypothetical protein